MEQKFFDYIRHLDILEEHPDTDFSDPAFAYDYNEVQELYFDEKKNNSVFLAGESGLRKKDMLARICKDLLMRGVEKDDILYLDYDLPILHGEDVLFLIARWYKEREQSSGFYLIINEIQECGDWFALAVTLKNHYPDIKLLCTSSTPPYIYERIYDEGCDWCKIVVLSKKNASNIKYQSQTFGVFEEFKYNQKGDFIEIKGMTKAGKSMPHHTVPATINGKPVKIIASGAFHDRTEMLSIDLPDTIEMIGDYAFSSCDSLTSAIVPDSVTEIGKNAFSKCYNLASITIPESVTKIGEKAFSYCSKLTSITIPESVTEIGRNSFLSCAYLAEIGVSPENPNYTSVDGVLFTKDMQTLVCYPVGKTENEYVIPDGVTSVGDNAFERCNSLKSVILSDSVMTIGDYAFSYCGKLSSVTIPNSVTEIGDHAFFSCKSLTSVTVPDSVTEIGAYAFNNCTTLRSITIPNSVTKIGEGTFSQCPNLTVKCTEGSYAQEYLERNDIRFIYLTSDTDMPSGETTVSSGGSETSASSSSDTDAQEDNVIIIAVAAAVCAVIIAVAACMVVRRKKHKTARSQDNGQNDSGDNSHSREQEPNRDKEQDQSENQDKS